MHVYVAVSFVVVRVDLRPGREQSETEIEGRTKQNV
jgi:hypothetical protein